MSAELKHYFNVPYRTHPSQGKPGLDSLFYVYDVRIMAMTNIYWDTHGKHIPKAEQEKGRKLKRQLWDATEADVLNPLLIQAADLWISKWQPKEESK